MSDVHFSTVLAVVSIFIMLPRLFRFFSHTCYPLWRTFGPSFVFVLFIRERSCWLESS